MFEEILNTTINTPEEFSDDPEPAADDLGDDLDELEEEDSKEDESSEESDDAEV